MSLIPLSLTSCCAMDVFFPERFKSDEYLPVSFNMFIVLYVYCSFILCISYSTYMPYYTYFKFHILSASMLRFRDPDLEFPQHSQLFMWSFCCSVDLPALLFNVLCDSARFKSHFYFPNDCLSPRNCMAPEQFKEKEKRDKKATTLAISNNCGGPMLTRLE